MIEPACSATSPAGPPCDAFLLVSFGGPEKTEDVLPFLENVTRGRNISRSRLLEVAEHYYHFGGAGPIRFPMVPAVAEGRRPT